MSRILAWNEKVRDNGDEKRKIQGREKRMKIRRVVLTVVLLPVLLAMKALIFLCLFLTAVSSGLLSIVLAAGDDSTGEHIPDSDKKRTDSVCERMAD